MIKEDKSGLRALSAAAASSGHKIQKVAQGVGHHLNNKTWDKVTQHPGKVNLNAVSDTSQTKNKFDKKTPDATPKGGHKRFTTSSMNTGATSTHSHDREKHVDGSPSEKPRIPGGKAPGNRNPADTSKVNYHSFIAARKVHFASMNQEETVPLVEKHVGFKKLKDQLSKEKGVSDPGALAAAIGRKKYGAKGMAAKAHHKEELEFDLDEAKRKAAGKKVPMAPSSVSAPIKGPNQDQSGEGVDHSTAAYTISDETRPEGELTEISKNLASKYHAAASNDFVKKMHAGKGMSATHRHMSINLASKKIKDWYPGGASTKGNAKVPATEETIAEIVTLDHIKPVQMPSPTVITSRNGAKNASSLQKTATKRDNQQMAQKPTNEEVKKRETESMDKLFDSITKLTEKEQLPAFTSNQADEREMLFASWKNKKRNITGD